jgi:PhnB protein
MLKENTMQLNPYLMFNGQCETAFKFYEKCSGGKLAAMVTYGESPMAEQTSSEWQDKVMHAHLIVGKQELMGADAPPGMEEKPEGFSVCLQFDDPVEAEQLFYVLAENGTVKMPIQETFWAARFGMLIDQFGTPWMINGGQPSE